MPAASIAPAVAPRLVIITEVIAPYRIPVFNALAQRREIDLHVVFLSETDPTLRQWLVYKNEIKFSYRVLPSWRRRVGKYKLLLNRAVHSSLREIKPDVIVCGGYNYPAAWSAAYWAKRHSVPFLLWTESTARDRRGNYLPVEFLKKYFLRLCSAFIVPGKSSLDYLNQLGVSEKQVTVARNAVDTELFSASAHRVRYDNTRTRGQYQIPSRYFLFVGRLVREKGIFDLLEAYAQLTPKIRGSIGLVFAGEGSDGRSLREKSSQVKLGEICFPGFIHRDELPMIYASAEALVFPTHSDPWGLVVNEAMACGLPVITTDVAGCALDLVEDNDNGFIVPPGAPTRLANAMEKLATNPELQKQMSSRSRERTQAYSPAEWATGVVEAVEAIVRK